MDRVHVCTPARRRPRDEELSRGHPVHPIPAWTVAVRVLLGHHPGGQLHAAQHLSRAPLEVPSQPRRLLTCRRPVPGLRPTVRRLFARATLRFHRYDREQMSLLISSIITLSMCNLHNIKYFLPEGRNEILVFPLCNFAHVRDGRFYKNVST